MPCAGRIFHQLPADDVYNGVSGQLDGPSSYLMKSPMNQCPDNLAREATERFIADHARDAKAAAKAKKAAAKAAQSPTTVEH